jgi:hypothetical protein
LPTSPAGCCPPYPPLRDSIVVDSRRHASPPCPAGSIMVRTSIPRSARGPFAAGGHRGRRRYFASQSVRASVASSVDKSSRRLRAEATPAIRSTGRPYCRPPCKREYDAGGLERAEAAGRGISGRCDSVCEIEGRRPAPSRSTPGLIAGRRDFHCMGRRRRRSTPPVAIRGRDRGDFSGESEDACVFGQRTALTSPALRSKSHPPRFAPWPGHDSSSSRPRPDPLEGGQQDPWPGHGVAFRGGSPWR